MGIKDTHHPMRIPDRIYAMWIWHYWYRLLLGWLPVQFCMICGKPYWGGLPRFWYRKVSTHPSHRMLMWTWQASWMDYCSKKCANEDEP